MTRKALIKTLVIMKISVVLMVACLQVSVAGTGIAQSVSLSEKNASLKEIFKEIRRQTGYEFLYSSKTLALSNPVDIDVKDATLEEVLAICFNKQPLTYVISERTIVVKPLETKEEMILPTPIETVLFEVTGTVTSKAGEIMPGVNVVVKGTTTGTATDSEGKFSIGVEDGDALVFSFIGFKKQEQQVGGRILIDVVMEEDIMSLAEVTISGGYYETTDKLKTGSIVKVTAKEIENQPVTSPLMALQGRVAGLDITPNSGTPGNAPQIRIRGINSLRNMANAENGNFPLYVIDGVPVSSVPMKTSDGGGRNLTYGGYDPLSTINPSNIASIEVLKDGDATAIYGSRGANGVILITTKKATNKTEYTNFDLSLYAGVGKVSKKMDVLSTKQYIQMRKEALSNDGLVPGGIIDADLVFWDTTRYTDWQKDLLGGTANILDMQGGISAGNKNTTFSLGGGYHKETLIYPGDFGYARGSVSLNINHTSSDQRFRASATANYGVDVSKLFGGDFVYAALTLPPNAPKLYDADGNLNWEMHDSGGGATATWDNPARYLKMQTKMTTRNLVASGNFSYELFQGFSLLTSLGFTDMVGMEQNKIPISSQPPVYANYGGVANFTDTKRTSWIIEPKASYSKKMGIHKLEIITGATWQKSSQLLNVIGADGYKSDALLGSLMGAGNISVIVDDLSEYKYCSFYGRIGYNLNQKYLLNATGRRDGSSRFGPGNRFANFWAVGSAWIFSEENFIKNNLPFLNFAKIRASYGVTGSDNIGDYKYYDFYNVLPSQYQGNAGVVPNALYNPEFAWEVTKKLEGAIELAFFSNRLSTEVNWYRNQSSNQLIDYPLPATTGFQSVLQNFEAVVQNTGWEVVVRGDVFSSSDWRWNLSMNFTLPDNKLVKFDGIENSPYATTYKIGEPLSIQRLYRSKGVNPETGRYEVEDRNSDGFINDLDRVLINPMDKSFYGGLNNTLQYKNIELSFLLQFTHQQKQRILFSYMPGTHNNQPVEVLDRWRETGDQTSIQKFSTNSYTDFFNAYSSDYNVTDASFIRLKTISISYLLPQEWLNRVKLQQAKVFLQGQNLFTLTKYDGLDPETGVSLPPLRMITTGIQLKF